MLARLAVLISGRGSNLQSIVAASRNQRLPAAVAAVVSDRADAGGLLHARDAGIDAQWMDPKAYANRAGYDRALAEALRERQVDFVCLAGFMRIVGQPLLDAFPNRILNIHPSLLPAFPGRHAQRQALEHGVRISGATVHLVTGELDNGPIILQSAVPVHEDDSIETLSSRILAEEHRLYPEAIRLVVQGGWTIEGRRFRRRRD
jgi:phosphoribosylglycinamide formyltransferase-1